MVDGMRERERERENVDHTRPIRGRPRVKRSAEARVNETGPWLCRESAARPTHFSRTHKLSVRLTESSARRINTLTQKKQKKKIRRRRRRWHTRGRVLWRPSRSGPPPRRGHSLQRYSVGSLETSAAAAAARTSSSRGSFLFASLSLSLPPGYVEAVIRTVGAVATSATSKRQISAFSALFCLLLGSIRPASEPLFHLTRLQFG